MTDSAPTPALTEEDVPIDPRLQWRIQRFEDMGFDTFNATQLAHAKDREGVPLYWRGIAEVLRAGCDHQTVVRIYA